MFARHYLRLGCGLLLLAALVAPALALPPTLPTIPPGTYNITNYGAVGDGATTNTAAIQNAINAANAAGVGTVEVPPGTWLTGPLAFKSSINLQIDAGAVLRMLPYDKYPGGITNPPDFITGSSLHDIEISGSGAIDGQGAPWWPGYKTNNRPYMVSFSTCNRVWIRNTIFSNAPAQHIVIKGKAGNVTIDNITVLAPASGAPVNPSHNTDAIDIAETNCVIQNCNISVGDDNVAAGSTASATADLLITNCTFGAGHGVSIGSNTSGGVSNMTVINCTFNTTDNGIRIKSDNDRGGIVQNISYLNLGMTNVRFPIVIYGYYNSFGTPSSITPAAAAAQPVAGVNATTPVYRNITISNIYATAVSGFPAAIIWPRTELPATNITLSKINLSASKPVEVYNAKAVTIADAQLSIPSSTAAIQLFDADITLSNSAPSGTVFTLDGVTINGYGNSFAVINANGALSNTNAFDDGPLTLSAATFAISNRFTMAASGILNFALGTNAAQINIYSNLNLGGTINISAGAGFKPGNYALASCTGTRSGTLPALGTVPAGYLCSLNTNTPGQLILSVSLPPPPVIGAPLVIGTNIVLKVTGGPTNGTSYILGTTNILVPLYLWTRISTNQFDGLGTLWFTNSIAADPAWRFYALQLQ